LRGAAIVSLLLLVPACFPHVSIVPVEIASVSDELAVAERSSIQGSLVDESFKLGSYSIDAVDRDWPSKLAFNVNGNTDVSAESSYAYKVRTKAAVLSGSCHAARSSSSWRSDGRKHTVHTPTTLGCECAGSVGPVKLVVTAEHERRASGELRTSHGSYQVTGLYWDGSWSYARDPAGYLIQNEQQQRGAVDVEKLGRAWLPRGLAEPDRTELACLFAGLLLYKGLPQ
jgi:hypothetical protein